MSEQAYQWQLFYRPRNGRITIEACALCGVAKGMVYQGHQCRTFNGQKTNWLNGWSDGAPISHYAERIMTGA